MKQEEGNTILHKMSKVINNNQMVNHVKNLSQTNSGSCEKGGIAY